MTTKNICNILNNSFCTFDISGTFDVSGTFDISKPNLQYPIQNSHFGVFQLKVDEIEPNNIKSKQHFVFVIDHSGSMSYKCRDQLTKMAHVIHTMNKIVQYFFETTIPIFLSVFIFDNNFTEILKMVKLDNSSKNNILEKINNIRPKGLTNIELALKNTNIFINDCLKTFPEINITHIFMTDGDVTVGSSDVKILQSNCVSSIPNIFIGFGLDHNAYILSTLGSLENNGYYFIDNMERSGLVYGEVLSSILCCVAKKASVKITNGYIYNWKLNIWETELFIGNIVSDKTFHLITEDPNTFNCKLSMKLIDDNSTVQGYITCRESSEGSLTKYKYRQQTQELLFETQKIHKESLDSVKDKMTTLLENMNTYMNSLTNENDKKFMKLLCDDMYVCIRTRGTPHEKMYSCIRHLSQGSQRVYSSGSVPKSNGSDYYQISDYSETPYSAKSVQTIMDFLDSKDS